MGEPGTAGKAVLKSFTKTLTEPKIAALSVSLVVSLVYCIYIYYYSEKSLTTTLAETPWMNSEKTSSMAPTTSASLVLLSSR